MNYPDLEACLVIEAEFPFSEYVWASHELGGVEVTETTTRRRANSNEFKVLGKILCPAPICEELGEWIKSKGFNLITVWFGIGNWKLYNPYSVFCISYELNETQARAEAVKLILEQK